MGLTMAHLNMSMSAIFPNANDKEIGKVLISMLQHIGQNKDNKDTQSYTTKYKDCTLTFTLNKNSDYPVQLQIKK